MQLTCSAVEQNEVATAYEAHYGLLVGLAIDRFHISETDAETLVHEVFLDFLLKISSIRDPRSWLVGAVCNASRYYLRRSERTIALPADFGERADPRQTRIAEVWTDQLQAREAFGCLTARCQLALRLRYLEEYSVPEIAEELKTSAKYAQKLVRKCLEQAHRRYAAKEARK